MRVRSTLVALGAICLAPLALARSAPPTAFEPASAPLAPTSPTTAPVQSTCAVPYPLCDDPLVRDTFLNADPVSIHLSIHVFCNNGGNRCVASEADVNQAVQHLNDNFAPYGFSFTHETEFVYDNLYRIMEEWNPGPETAMMKTLYADSPATKLNVYVVRTYSENNFGTLPWQTYAQTARGGIIVHEYWLRNSSTSLTNMLGTTLGLWHTYHGVDEVAPCSDCYERAGRSVYDGDRTGDLCSDTEPTPSRWGECSQPLDDDPCSGLPWGSETPIHNYMGGAGSSCKYEFTPQQVARMHCYAELVLSSWLQAPPTPTPGISVSPTAGLVTSEAGGMDSFTVVLDAPPTSPVTVGVSTDDPGEGRVSAGTQPLGPAVVLAFDGSNWADPQTVTVMGWDDLVLDGDISYAFVTAPAASADLAYAGLDADDVTALNVDDESPPGISVTGISPATMDVGSTVAVSVSGSGFLPNATVTFEGGSGRAPTASNVVVVNSTTLSATLRARRGGPGGVRVWDVRITNVDASTGVLVGGFTVIK